MIVDKELVVSNRKKAEIVTDLRKHKFRPFPKGAAKAAGETEEVVEEEEEQDDVGGGDADYDYLLGMAIWSLTKEKVRSAFSPDLRTNAEQLIRSRNCVHKRKRKKMNFSSSLRNHPRIFGTLTLTLSLLPGM